MGAREWGCNQNQHFLVDSGKYYSFSVTEASFFIIIVNKTFLSAKLYIVELCKVLDQ